MLSRDRVRDLLTNLSAEVEISTTEYVPPGSVALPAAKRLEKTVEGWVPESAEKLGTGLVLVAGPRLRLAISPPFPLQRPATTWPGPDFAPLNELISAPRTVAVVLLRLGAYAVGIAEDARLVTSKTGTRYVHGRHRAGGQSQRRFERNREQWIAKLFDEACRVLRDRLRPYEGRIDHLTLGGDRHVLSRFMKRCDALRLLEDRLLPRSVPVERPNLASLEKACEAIWASRVFRAPEREGVSCE